MIFIELPRQGSNLQHAVPKTAVLPIELQGNIFNYYDNAICFIAIVGLTGFEPATFCSQSRRATKLRHNPNQMDRKRDGGFDFTANAKVRAMKLRFKRTVR